MGDWPEKTLGEVAEFLNGYPFKPSELGQTGLPVVRIKQLLDPNAECDRSTAVVRERSHIADGDLIFSWSGTLAARIWSRGPALLNQHLYKVVERGGILRLWLHLALDDAVDELMLSAHGTTMKHVTKKALERHVVRVPPLDVQGRIVDLVGALDANIAALDAEAVWGASLLDSIRTVLFDALASGPTSRLSDVASKIGSGATPRGGDNSYIAKGIPLIRSQNVRDGRFSSVGLAHISDSAASKLDSVTVDAEDVLINITGASVARVCRAPREVTPARVNQHVAILRPDPDIVSTPFLEQWLLSQSVRQTLLDLSSGGSTRQALTKKQLGDLRVPIPDIGEQERISGILSALASGGQSVEIEVDALRNVRAALLPALLSGDIEIPESYDELVGAL